MVGHEIGHLVNLRDLKLEDCGMDYEHLANLPLQTLTLRRQPISRLPVLAQLEVLSISQCAISSFELFPSLRKLTLQSITSRYDIEIEEIDPLDYVDYNQDYIPLVQFGHLPFLEELFVTEARISGYLKAPALKTLEFEHIYIQDALVLEECFALKVVRLNSCVGPGMHSLRLEHLTCLQFLHIGVAIPISFTDLEFPSSLLYLSVELRNSRAMDSFDSMKILEAVPRIKSLKKLQFSEWHWVNLDSFHPSSLPLQVQTLIADGNGLRNIERLNAFSLLVVLNLDWNSIEDVSPLGSFALLEDLSLAHNRIKEISQLGKCKKLKRLVLSYNCVQDLRPLRMLAHLYTLEITSNPVKFR
jgi:Leucine-rich repeat (LRR) protein